jgi:hypothetical protein
MKKLLLGVMLIPAFFGLGLIGAGLHNLRLAAASKSWPSVPGEVTNAEALGSTRMLSSRKHVDQYQPVTKYSYTVDGELYTSTRIRLVKEVPVFDVREAAVATAERSYPVGSSVQVYYDPENPGFALLDPRSPTEGLFVLFTLGPLLVALGVVLTWLVARLVPEGPKRPAFAVCPSCQCEFPVAGRAKGGLCPSCAGGV